MPFTKEQQQEYYQKNKAKLNQQRAERRKSTGLRQSDSNKVETIERVETLKRHTEVETPNPINQVETKVNEVAQPKKKVETTEIKKEVETEVKPVTPEVSSEKVVREDERFITY